MKSLIPILLLVACSEMAPVPLAVETSALPPMTISSPRDWTKPTHTVLVGDLCPGKTVYLAGSGYLGAGPCYFGACLEIGPNVQLIGTGVADATGVAEVIVDTSTAPCTRVFAQAIAMCGGTGRLSPVIRGRIQCQDTGAP